MNQYSISNTKSNYFGITCQEIEHYKSETHGEIWVKVVFDYVSSVGNMCEVCTWFQASELTLV